MNDNAVKIRRARISNYLDDHDSVGIDQPKLISNELGIDYDTVKNDLRWFDDTIKARLKGFNLSGLLRKTLEKRDRIHQIQLKVREIAKNNSNDPNIQLKAYQIELKAIHDEFDIESDGITLLVDEIDSRKEDVADKA